MKCPSCGAETKGNVCEYCGSELIAESKARTYCQKCGSPNVAFRRENQGEIRGKKEKIIVHKTVGYCKDCGNTWFVSEDGTKKRKTWLWVLGWIFIFPLPLTILLLRNKKMKPVLKYGLIAAAWVIYLVIALVGRSSDNGRDTTRTSAQSDTPTKAITSNLTELSFTRTNDVTLKVGGSYSAGFVKAVVKTSSDFSAKDVLFVSDNPDVATISLTEVALSTYLYYEITAVGPGETKVYAMSHDGSIVSETIHVTVVEPVQVESITINDVDSDLVLGDTVGCIIKKHLCQAAAVLFWSVHFCILHCALLHCRPSGERGGQIARATISFSSSGAGMPTRLPQSGRRPRPGRSIGGTDCRARFRRRRPAGALRRGRRAGFQQRS